MTDLQRLHVLFEAEAVLQAISFYPCHPSLVVAVPILLLPLALNAIQLIAAFQMDFRGELCGVFAAGGSAESVRLPLLYILELRLGYLDELFRQVHILPLIDTARVAQRDARFRAVVLVDQDASKH